LDAEYQEYKNGVTVQLDLVRKVVYAFAGEPVNFSCTPGHKVILEDAQRTLYQVRDKTVV
jgi:hypothetical protein